MHEAIANEVLNVADMMSTMIDAGLLVATVLAGIVSVHLAEDLLWMITTIASTEDGHHLETTLRLLQGDTTRIRTMPEALLHLQEATIHMPDTRILTLDRGLHQEVLTEVVMVATTIEDTEHRQGDSNGTPRLSELAPTWLVAD